MTAVHLVKTYRLPALTYGCENAVFCDNTLSKINVTWNNCFRHIFNCCWRESVKPLQYFCSNMPMTYQIDQMKLVFWEKMFVNDNTILYSLSRLMRDRFAAVASKYGTLSLAQSVSNIKQVVWNSFMTNIRF